jgi:hypothetical protein
MTSKNDASQSNAHKPVPLSADQGVPRELAFIGIVVGMICVLFGLYVTVYHSRIYNVGIFSFCVGFGIILGVFGARAAGTWRSWSVAGCGALAIIAFLLLTYKPTPLDSRYVRGEITQAKGVSNVTGTASHAFLVGKGNGEDDFRFVVFPEDMESKEFFFTFDMVQESNDFKTFFIGCIASQLIDDAMEQHTSLSLSLEFGKDQQGNPEYYLLDARQNSRWGQFNKRRCPAGDAPPPAAAALDPLSMFSNVARAQSVDDEKLAYLISELESENGDSRDFARELLSNQREPAAYQAMTSTWDVARSSYRADLGRLVVWASAISQDPRMAVYVADALNPGQIAYVTQLMGQGDATMRQYATEVFSRLLATTSRSDGPAVDKLNTITEAATGVFINRQSQTVEKIDVVFKRENMEYNTLVSINFSGCDIGRTYRPVILAALRQYQVQIGPNAEMQKTNGLLWQVITQLSNCV